MTEFERKLSERYKSKLVYKNIDYKFESLEDLIATIIYNDPTNTYWFRNGKHYKQKTGRIRSAQDLWLIAKEQFDINYDKLVNILRCNVFSYWYCPDVNKVVYAVNPWESKSFEKFKEKVKKEIDRYEE